MMQPILGQASLHHGSPWCVGIRKWHIRKMILALALNFSETEQVERKQSCSQAFWHPVQVTFSAPPYRLLRNTMSHYALLLTFFGRKTLVRYHTGITSVHTYRYVHSTRHKQDTLHANETRHGRYCFKMSAKVKQ